MLMLMLWLLLLLLVSGPEETASPTAEEIRARLWLGSGCTEHCSEDQRRGLHICWGCTYDWSLVEAAAAVAAAGHSG